MSNEADLAQFTELLPSAGLALAAIAAAIYTAWHTTRGARRNQAREMAQHQFTHLVRNHSFEPEDAVELLGALQRHYYCWIRKTERRKPADPGMDETVERCLDKSKKRSGE